MAGTQELYQKHFSEIFTDSQPNKEVLFRERGKYAENGEALIQASHVVAVHFQTIAAANDYWK